MYKPPSWDQSKLSSAALQAIRLKEVARAELDPREPESVDEMLDALPSVLLELYEYCECHDVTNFNELADAPEHIKTQMFENFWKILG